MCREGVMCMCVCGGGGGGGGGDKVYMCAGEGWGG